MSNDKVAATFHGEDDEDETQPDPWHEPPIKATIPVPGIVHMTPEDPTVTVPHAHMDEH
jgi:hypothetical protein